jgi:hypothetical protein
MVIGNIKVTQCYEQDQIDQELKMKDVWNTGLARLSLFKYVKTLAIDISRIINLNDYVLIKFYAFFGSYLKKKYEVADYHCHSSVSGS